MGKFDQIAAFMSIVEEGNFVKAAKKHEVSTAAISRQIYQLEAALHSSLLKRTTRQVQLTETGRQYYQQCKQALSLLNEAETAITKSQQEASGILTVLANRYFAQQFLIPRLPLFMEQNSRLQIKLELAERFPDFATENIDMVFGVSFEGPDVLVRKQVASTRYVLCASPNYLKIAGIPQKPLDLINHRYITHSMRKPDNVILFKDEKEIVVRPFLWLNDSSAMRECAIQGMGIVNLHDYIVKDALNEGKLIEILPEFQIQKQPVYLYYQQNKYLQPKIRKFIDFYTNK